MAAATDELSKYSRKKNSFSYHVGRHRRGMGNRLVNYTSRYQFVSSWMSYVVKIGMFRALYKGEAQSQLSCRLAEGNFKRITFKGSCVDFGFPDILPPLHLSLDAVLSTCLQLSNLYIAYVSNIVSTYYLMIPTFFTII